MPQRASISSCVPTSMIRPACMTTMRSASDERGQAVRDDDRGAVADEGLQHLLDRLLALQVDLAGGLVEDEDGRVAEDRPGQGDALPLPAGEPAARACRRRFRSRGPVRVR